MIKDLTGLKFGRLTVIERAENDKRGGARWRCKCDCGNETVVAGGKLKRGLTKSCGCLNREKSSERFFKDLTGQKFGRLTVLGVDHKKPNNHGGTVIYWLCRCDCGNEVVVLGGSLKRGNTKSCGCLSREKTSERLFKDLTGMKFGRLTVLERAANKGKKTAWRCKCDCGNSCVVAGNNLRSGEVKSCGCLRGQNHGLRNDKFYNTWCNIKKRCFNTGSSDYKYYGGRGITMFPAWIHDFQAFYNYVSKLPHFGEEGYSLDRIDNNGNYAPGNIRFADVKTQCRNRRSNHIVEYNGETMTLAEAAELSGIPYATLKRRCNVGDTGDRLFRPVNHGSSKKFQ